MNPWVAYCDGSAVPNPGRMGLGAVLTAPDGTRHSLSELAREHGCNNEAEVRALMATLRALKSLGADMLLL
ncbi:MAG: ribonuclease, partial [Rhodoferax sp.]|nr:ribonuclease [Rhodoferax sp.]